VFGTTQLVFVKGDSFGIRGSKMSKEEKDTWRKFKFTDNSCYIGCLHLKGKKLFLLLKITLDSGLPFEEDDWLYIRIGDSVFRNAKLCAR
jgi:hypothetical protein